MLKLKNNYLKRKKGYTIANKHYTALTSILGLIFCLKRFSIPFFSVTVDEGQPLQAPFNSTLTILSLYDASEISPPSNSTAG